MAMGRGRGADERTQSGTFGLMYIAETINKSRPRDDLRGWEHGVCGQDTWSFSVARTNMPRVILSPPRQIGFNVQILSDVEGGRGLKDEIDTGEGRGD